MMEATVKRAIERAILTEFPSTDLEYDIDWEIMEISFKAGYDKRESEFVYNPDYLDFQKGVKTGRELGIREVVEWIEGNRELTVTKDNPIEFGLYPKVDWQAQKKGWLNEKE